MMTVSLFSLNSCSKPKPKAMEVDSSSVYIKNEKEVVSYDLKTKSGVCDEKRDAYVKMSDAELIQKAMEHDVGNCTYEEPKKCRDCQCLAYIKISKSEWPGHGWPLDPETNDGSGCVSAQCTNGYKSIMCETRDLKKNGAEQLRDALRNIAQSKSKWD